MKKALALLFAFCLAVGLLTGCGGGGGKAGGGEKPAATKKLTVGDTTFTPDNLEKTIDPHDNYSGWACIRYGVGETLVRYTDKMEVEPWLAKSWKNIDLLTWEITLRDGVKFHSGKPMDAAAVKACLEALVKNHDRAPKDLMIDSIEAKGQTLIIKTKEPRPALLHSLGDPYACIVDVSAGVKGGIVAGTGPYVAVECKSGDHLTLKKNANYWDGTPKLDELTIRAISNGNTLSAALQSGEIDAAYGMAYESYPLFQNDKFHFSQVATSRAFFLWMNYESPIASDPAVRKAIAMGVNKEGFVKTLLHGNGYPGAGAFPAGFAFGGDKVKAEKYDPEGAKKVLEAAGWVDTDGDGIREKDGKKLTVRWLTYPSRLELPLLAESAQAELKKIGVNVEVNSTASHNKIRKDPTGWDVYASAMVTAPTGDPEYFFTSCCLDSSPVNNGHFHSDKLEGLAKEMAGEFNPERRAKLAVDMQQTLLDDNGYVFCSFLQMSLISKKNVVGYDAHPCDYYQITAKTDIK